MFTTTKNRTAAAFVAGIALTAGGALTFQAMSVGAIGDDESTFVPVEPCRLFDTRPAPDNVGPKSTPLGENSSFTQQVTGANGDCSIPNDATAISLNVTATNITAPSFLTVYPSDVVLPTASNLNYGPGQAATPNKVDVKLSAAGSIDLYNRFGSVDVLADVLGYYTNSGLQELAAGIDDLRATQIVMAASAQPDSVVLQGRPLGQSVIPAPIGVVQAGDARRDGVVVLEATFVPPTGNASLTCTVSGGGTTGEAVVIEPGQDATTTIRLRVDVEQGDAIGGAATCFATTPPASPPVLPVPVGQPLLTATYTAAPAGSPSAGGGIGGG